MLRIMFLLCLTFAIGCVKHHYIVYREVPEAPTFVVIPLSHSEAEMAFSAIIEKSIMANGVKIVQRPVIKQHEVVRSRDNDAFFSKKGPEDVTESFSAYSIPPDYADYFVLTTSAARRVKIYNPKTKEILAIFQVVYELNSGISRKYQSVALVGRYLDAMGVPISYAAQPETSETRIKIRNWRLSLGIVLLTCGTFVVLSLIH